MELLRIGEMARLNHISEQTLRLYDRMGLLSPALRDAQSNYRFYDIRQSARLDVIRYMKSMGMSLQDIGERLADSDTDGIIALLQQKHGQIGGQIEELQCQQHTVQRAIDSLRYYQNAPPDGGIQLEHLGTRTIYCMDSGVNFYDYGIEMYERILRKLMHSIIVNRLPQIYFCNSGSIMRQSELMQRRFFSTEIFVFVDPQFVPEQFITVIPEGDYMCMYCDAFEKEKEYVLRLLDEIDRQGYRVCGDYVCEILNELFFNERSIREMFFRLQIPVERR